MFIDKSQDKIKEHFKYGINQWTGEPNKPVFYNDEMKKRVHEIQKPSMLLMDIVKYPDFLALRLYEDNFIQFEGTKKETKYSTKLDKMRSAEAPGKRAAGPNAKKPYYYEYRRNRTDKPGTKL